MVPRCEPAWSVLGRGEAEGTLALNAGSPPLPSGWARAPPRPSRPRAWGKRPRPEAPPGGPAQRLCLLRTWRGLGFPSAKLGSPPTLTIQRGPQSEATAKPRRARLVSCKTKGGAGPGPRTGARAPGPRCERAWKRRAGGGGLGPLPVPTPPSQRAGVRPAGPTEARLAQRPGQIDRLAWAPAAPRGLRGWAPPLFAHLHLHSN